MWDTAGQERFRHLVSSYYRGMHGIFVVYDMTNQESFESVINWMKEIEKYAKDDVVKILVGNKSDLKSKKVVDYEKALELANNLDIDLFETSAKNGKNVSEMFMAMITQLKDRVQIAKENSTVDLKTPVNISNQNNTYCCSYF